MRKGAERARAQVTVTVNPIAIRTEPVVDPRFFPGVRFSHLIDAGNVGVAGLLGLGLTAHFGEYVGFEVELFRDVRSVAPAGERYLAFTYVDPCGFDMHFTPVAELIGAQFKDAHEGLDHGEVHHAHAFPRATAADGQVLHDCWRYLPLRGACPDARWALSCQTMSPLAAMIFVLITKPPAELLLKEGTVGIAAPGAKLSTDPHDPQATVVTAPTCAVRVARFPGTTSEGKVDGPYFHDKLTRLKAAFSLEEVRPEKWRLEFELKLTPQTPLGLNYGIVAGDQVLVCRGSYADAAERKCAAVICATMRAIQTQSKAK